MGRFVRARWNPKTESSVLPSTAGQPNPKRVELVTGSGLCECGCRNRPKGKTSEFAMGHDQRLRGVLIRAHLAETDVAEFRVTDADTWEGTWSLRSAMAHAERFGWEGYLTLAWDREERLQAEKLERANRTVLEDATGIQAGDRRLIRVGRWEHTGQVVAIFDDGDTVEFQYVTKGGDIRRVRKPKSEAEALPEVMD